MHLADGGRLLPWQWMEMNQAVSRKLLAMPVLKPAMNGLVRNIGWISLVS